MADDAGTLDARIRFAIANTRLVEVRYEGRTRVAEPHDYGVQKGIERLFVYQLRGQARPGHTVIGWRLLDLPKMEALDVLDETFKGSRGASHSAHQKWDILYARVK